MKKIILAAWLITVTFLAYANPQEQAGAATAPNSTPPDPAASASAPNNTAPASSTSPPATPTPPANAGDSKTPPKQTLVPSNSKKADAKDDKKPNTQEVKKECTIKPVMTDEDYYICGTKPPGYVVHFHNAK